MKQTYTQHQWDSLPDFHKRELRRWFDDTYDFPAGIRAPLYIGNLIQFLGEDYIYELYNHAGHAVYTKVKPDDVYDILWAATIKKIDNMNAGNGGSAGSSVTVGGCGGAGATGGNGGAGGDGGLYFEGTEGPAVIGVPEWMTGEKKDKSEELAFRYPADQNEV